MLTKKPTYQWYAMYTKAKGEKKLCENLAEKNIECYLPIKKVLKIWSDRKKWIEEPLFRSYIFVKVSYKEFFTALNMQGAVCFVSFGGKAQAIPEIQITNLKTLVNQNDEEITLTYKNIRKGQKAEVIHGSLKGIQGEIVELFGQSRILIRIDSLNCSLHANISKDEIKILKELNYKTTKTKS